MKSATFEDLGFAKGEPHRITRQGFPEAIFCPGKTVTQITKIFAALRKGPGPVIATRASQDVATALIRENPDAVHHPIPRLVVWSPKQINVQTNVLVLT